MRDITNRWIGVAILFILITISPSSAWTIDNPNHIFQITNATITFPTNQTYDSFGIGADYISLNGSRLQITSTAPINVSINQYYTINSYYNMSFNGTAYVSFNQITQPGAYRVVDNGVVSFPVNTIRNILYNTITLDGLDIIVISFVNAPINVLACPDANDSVNTAFVFVGILLIIISAGLIIQMLYTKKFDMTLLIPAIVFIIVGSIMILVGYFLVVTVGSVTC